MSSKAKQGAKKGSDKDECKSRRENRCIGIRKEKREEGIDKRRRAPVEDVNAVGEPGGVNPDEPVVSVEMLPAYCTGELYHRAQNTTSDARTAQHAQYRKFSFSLTSPIAFLFFLLRRSFG